MRGFTCGSAVKNLFAMQETQEMQLQSLGQEDPLVGNGNPLQYSGLENSMDRGAWRATVHGVAKNWTQPKPKQLSTHARPCCCHSLAQSCLTLCDPTDCSTPDFPVLHHLLELSQAHVHWVSDAIQSSHPLFSPSVFSLSQHQGLFQWVCCLHQVAKILELQLQHQSCQWSFRVNCRTLHILSLWISLLFTIYVPGNIILILVKCYVPLTCLPKNKLFKLVCAPLPLKSLNLSHFLNFFSELNQ